MLLYAHREELDAHDRALDWLRATLGEPTAFGLSDLVLSGFLRVATHPRVFDPPTPLERALAFVRALAERPNRVAIEPGPRHWRIFTDLCVAAGASGNMLPDAFLAALAIESGSEWITLDRGFARYPGLRWRHPLED